MSSGYASRLSEYKDKGVCGLPENKDTKRRLAVKLKRLTELIQKSNHTVVLTGAGISTSAGIPDFRGPYGIWTEESQRKRKRSKAPPISVGDFAQAQPTLTHRAILKLVELGQVQYCITQNVDGLHRRSGLSRQYHSVLHGCVFTEVCEQCQTEHFRDYDVGGMSCQRTGRTCEECGGHLRDIVLDWEDELPERDFERATDQCEQADLVICLGTSLRIEPAGSLPTFAKKFVIVNLQETPYDDEAELIVRAPVDDVMNEVLTQLGHPDWDNEDREAEIQRKWKPPKTMKDK
jgi:mono-ADP-ribosyltransferase sirtuin 6